MIVNDQKNMHKPAKDQSSQQTHAQAEIKRKRKDSQNYQRKGNKLGPKEKNNIAKSTKAKNNATLI